MKSYKFKLKPSKSVQAKFEQTIDLCRELYNSALQESRDAWKINKVSVNYYIQQAQLPEIKESRPEFKNIYSQILQDVLSRVSKTFDNFFRRFGKGDKVGFPRFKGMSFFNSFCYPQSGFKLIGDKLYLSKIGTVRLRLSRKIEGKIKTCTIKCEVDGWFVIFVCENEKQPLEKTGFSVGIDVGIKTFATLSNGEKIINPHFLLKAERRLKTAQRNVSRKKKGSKNRKKAIKLLQKKHLKIKRQRLDFLHKISTQLVHKFDDIAVESLHIKNMVKNHNLAKSISDASWATFLNLLTYKAENADKKVWKVNPRNTSQICSQCGEIIPKSLSERIHKCSYCGLTLDRDLNAAKNILVRAEPLLMSSDTKANDARIHA